jgi:hypothetical protein
MQDTAHPHASAKTIEAASNSPGWHTPEIKSFLLLFFKKEVLLFLKKRSKKTLFL